MAWTKYKALPKEHFEEDFGPQFQGFTGGPQEALARHRELLGTPSVKPPGEDRERLYRAVMKHWQMPRSQAAVPAARAKLGHTGPEGDEWYESQHQGQLFDPHSLPRPEAHQQTPEQFAADPRTWWHGRVMRDSPRSKLGGAPGGRDEGFHAGTKSSAMQRLTANIRRRGLKGPTEAEPARGSYIKAKPAHPGMVGRLFPLRITGPVQGPEKVLEDVERHSAAGQRQTGYLYENATEHAGSLSIATPRRVGYMSTHREMVEQAQKEGKYVHPMIAWAAKHHPEHSGWGQRSPYQLPSPEGERYQQPDLTEHLRDTGDWEMASTIRKQMTAYPKRHD